MPAPEPAVIEKTLAEAAGQVKTAASVRRRYRRRDARLRVEELSEAQAACAEVSKRIRSLIGGVAYYHNVPFRTEMELAEASKALRYERRQIAKMLA